MPIDDGVLRASQQTQRLRQHFSADTTDIFIERLGIVLERARERGAPQELVIKIHPKGHVFAIDPTDNYKPVDGQTPGNNGHYKG